MDDPEFSTVTVRVYGSLNDFLPAAARQTSVTYPVGGRRSVKDFVESLGVPHPEIALLLVNGASASFDQLVRPADRIAAYPRFWQLDVAGVTRVRPATLPAVRFVADVHLRALVRLLRLVGLDTAYVPDASDSALVETAERDQRILLTRDVELLKRRALTRGYFVRDVRPRRQLVEVVGHFGPLPLAPCSRCPRCNGVVRPVDSETVRAHVPPHTRDAYAAFTQCSECRQVYWHGAHWRRLADTVRAALEASAPPASSS